MTLRSWTRTTLGREIGWPTVVLGGLALATLLALAVAASTTSAAFGLYNPSWDGTSDVRASIDSTPGTDLEIVQEPNRYETVPPNGTVAFVIAPEERYDDTDADRVRTFVEEGGTLIVLDNVNGSTNALLAAVGAEARLDGRLLLDNRHYDRGPAMPIATTVGNESRLTGVDRLTLNYATAVEPGNATPLSETSEYAYLADAETDEPDAETNVTAHPVATTEPVADGEVIVVGDPSIMINAMYEKPDNAAFLAGLYATGDRVLLDRSHAGGVPPLIALVETIRDAPFLQIGIGLLAIGLVAAVSRGRLDTVLDHLQQRLGGSDSRRRIEISDEELAQHLRDRYPDWNADRTEHVIAALNRDGPKRERDE